MRMRQGTVLVALLGLYGHVAHGQTDPGQYGAVAIDLVKAASGTFQRSQGVAIDGSVMDAVASELTNFAVTYGADPNCAHLALGTDGRAVDIVGGYLSDALLKRPAALTTLFARLATACGSSSEASGWPSQAQNTLGLVLFQQGPRHIARYGGPLGYIDYGAAARGIAFMQGRYELADIDAGGAPQPHHVVNVALGSNTILPSWNQVAGPVQSLPTIADISSAYFCLGSYPLSKRPEFGMHPSGPARAGPVPIKPATFSTAHVAAVEIVASADSCSQECWNSMATLIARTIAGWRGTCGGCQALLALDVAGIKFVDARVLEAIRSAGPNGPHLEPASTPENPLQSSAIVTGNSAKYVQLAPTDQQTSALCNRYSTVDPEWLLDVTSVICPNSKARAALSSAKLRVEFVPGDTNCGPTSSILACGIVDKGIQVTLADVLYEWKEPQTASLFHIGNGTAKFDLQYVLLHEFGHWMGLVDYDPVSDPVTVIGKERIMSNTYSDSGACISAGDTSLLAAAADVAWSGRLTSCSGLRRPASRRP